MDTIEALCADAGVTLRRGSEPDTNGRCIAYWMQRAQRALGKPALNVAIHAANILRKPVVAFLGVVPFHPHANLRHYAFLAQGIPDIADGLSQRGVGSVLRPWPGHHLLKFCAEVRPCLVVGDENPLREPERPILGTFWSMSYESTSRKFDSRAYREAINSRMPRR